MSLETGTYVSDLNTSNPVSGDPLSQTDDHLRLVKSTLQNTFPEASAPIYGHRSASVQASTSGTSVTFTSIPSWVKRIVVSFVGVSLNGTSVPMVQIGDSGGYETTGYSGSVATILNASATQAANYSGGFDIATASAATSVYHGTVQLHLVNASTNTWSAAVSIGASHTAGVIVGAGSKSLTATLDRLRILATNGTDTFDAGSININYD